ncbi:MAG: CHRD domain-containing protein [Gammaproteobacteria bacterium]|nr:CHRD domain-containing protein [Gammaproteobacteria bacterium]
MSGVQATPILYSAILSGSNEVPANASPGTGTATVAYDPIAHTLSLDVTFSGLSGNTTAAHIHCCAPPGANAAVATSLPSFLGFPAGVVSGLYSQVFDLTLASSFNAAFVAANGGTVLGAEAALSNGLAGGNAYLNIHTTAFPGGEIRGNLAPVPEPTTLGLIGLGLAGFGYARKRVAA